MADSELLAIGWSTEGRHENNGDDDGADQPYHVDMLTRVREVWMYLWILWVLWVLW
jgi:hypothetical protein